LKVEANPIATPNAAGNQAMRNLITQAFQFTVGERGIQ
jgi:hypothetical protein